jgi:GPH family glycoside/pentoside/hexuronide:cation symporter
MNKLLISKVKLKEKLGYALGDTAANIAWRTLTTFLMVFYTDVFGITAAAAGMLLLVTRFSDGLADVFMGMVADRTNTKNGKFRPWILWTAIPLGVILALTFTTPNFSPTGKLVYAYITYMLLMFIYTANNIPYSALMGVMTGDDKERTSIASFRFAGAYLGGIITQGFLIYLVLFLGNGNQNQGYQYSIYLFAAILSIFLIITYYSTKERVKPPKDHSHSSILTDLNDLVKNKPWVILLIIGFLFVTYNSIKQGITVIYFKRYINQEMLASSYMVVLLVISMIAALVTSPLAKFFGKKNLFIYVMIFSAITNALLHFAGNQDITLIFTLGALSEFGAGIMPVLFFTMLGDSADYSELKNGRRATGLVYSAGTFSMKFGGGVAAAIIGFLLTSTGYDGMSHAISNESLTGIKMLMSWIPALLAIPTVLVLMIYPLSTKKMEAISVELNHRRVNS